MMKCQKWHYSGTKVIKRHYRLLQVTRSKNQKMQQYRTLFQITKNCNKYTWELITRRSSVQIWLPQPGTVIWKITESRKSTQFRYFIEAVCFFIGVFSLYKMIHFSKKIEFDPNLIPKHQKKNTAKKIFSFLLSFQFKCGIM